MDEDVIRDFMVTTNYDGAAHRNQIADNRKENCGESGHKVYLGQEGQVPCP
jgi:hypothetical protein